MPTGLNKVLWLLGTITSLTVVASELEEPPILESDREHWAFQPLTRPSIPDATAAGSFRNPIDAFIAHERENRGLNAAPEADRTTLIRRLSFDLVGLPPEPEQVAAFLSDTRPDAYERLVDSFLASPAYGERWAQHWLDLARFAESDGFEHDIVRTDAWRYRDWVVRALNRDLPYDQFVTAQIAGDEVGNPKHNDQLATGFLVAGPDMPDINLNEERRHIVLNEMTGTVGAVFMGLGVACAQCHDHKFDPFSQADFYRLRSFFDNLTFPARNKQLGHQVSEKNDQAPVSHLAIRGDFRRPGPKVSPQFPRIVNLSGQAPEIAPQEKPSTYRRTTLAKWLTQPDHPLTSRVMVNRLWQHHFGRALVATPNDFGTQGIQPTHPQLLDWLATELVRLEWRLKPLHRLIVQSASYRQASHGQGTEWEHNLQADPENQFYSRMNRRRLTGETLRDAMLAVTGTLNREQEGPSVRPPLPIEVHNTLLRKNHWIESEAEEDHFRRSLYVFVRRNLRYPMFDVFDRPDANASCAKRSQTTTAPQSLNLLNSAFSLAMAQRMATVILDTSPQSAPAAVNALFRRALGRAARSDEMTLLAPYLADTLSHEALTDVCLAVFNLNEMLYID